MTITSVSGGDNTKVPPESSRKASRAGHWRWTIAISLGILNVINYADRAVLGVVGPLLVKDLGLSPAQFGLISAAFGWGYSSLIFFGGAIVAVLGPSRTLRYFVTAWSVVIGCTALVGNFAGLLIARLLFGAAEGPIYPAGARIIGSWFAPTERGRAMSFQVVGMPLGMLIVVPFGTVLGTYFGWQMPFIVLAVLSLLWVVVSKFILTDTPAGHRHISDAERDYIVSHTIDERGAGKHDSSTPWRRILLNGTLWQAGVAFFASAYVLYFLLSFFPTYLVNYRGIPYESLAILGTLPAAGMAVGILTSGAISDRLLRRTGSLRLARPVFAGVCLIIVGLCVAYSMTLSDTTMIVVIITVAATFNGLTTTVFMTFPLDVAPQYPAQASSVTTGLGSLASIVAPALTGLLVSASGNFTTAFIMVAALPLIFGLVFLSFCRPDPTKLAVNDEPSSLGSNEN